MLYQLLSIIILFHIFWDSNLTVYLEVTITEASEDDYEYEEVICSFCIFILLIHYSYSCEGFILFFIKYTFFS